MRFDGVWRVCDDGIVRPVLQGAVRAKNDLWIPAAFLADTAADRTVLSAEVLQALGPQPSGSAGQLEGVGGKASSVIVQTQIRLKCETGDMVLFKGHFAAVTDPAALDLCVLGRDITNLFAVIVDRPQDIVCLVGHGHRYVIVPG
jgi:hypothetical protein